jgi:hypothetical protein
LSNNPRKSKRENVKRKINQEKRKKRKGGKKKLDGSKSAKRILSIFFGVSATDGAELFLPPFPLVDKTNDVRQELKFSMQSAISNHLLSSVTYHNKHKHISHKRTRIIFFFVGHSLHPKRKKNKRKRSRPAMEC